LAEWPRHKLRTRYGGVAGVPLGTISCGALVNGQRRLVSCNRTIPTISSLQDHQKIGGQEVTMVAREARRVLAEDVEITVMPTRKAQGELSVVMR
jgi:hypothetical protein